MINRETYKKIKGYNREQMNTYLSELFSTSYNAGVEAMKNKVTEGVVNGLKNTNGIGDKRMKEALENINFELNK